MQQGGSGQKVIPGVADYATLKRLLATAALLGLAALSIWVGQP